MCRSFGKLIAHTGSLAINHPAIARRYDFPYVLEFYAAAFPNVGQGRIIRIANGVAEENVSGLNVPTDMALDRHDDIYVSDLGAAPGTAGRLLRFSNSISGQPLTTIEVRKPAPLEREDRADDDN